MFRHGLYNILYVLLPIYPKYDICIIHSNVLNPLFTSMVRKYLPKVVGLLLGLLHQYIIYIDIYIYIYPHYNTAILYMRKKSPFSHGHFGASNTFVFPKPTRAPPSAVETGGIPGTLLAPGSGAKIAHRSGSFTEQQQERKGIKNPKKSTLW